MKTLRECSQHVSSITPLCHLDNERAWAYNFYSLDAQLFHLIYGALHGPPWGTVLEVLTYLGDERLVLSVTFLGLLEAVLRRVKKPLMTPWVAVAWAAVFTAGLKVVFHRPRPVEVFSFLGVKAGAAELGRSFPSGHATAAFALATALSYRWPRLSGLWISLAVAAALSRIGLGLHWPTDVMVGACIGFGMVWSFAWLERRFIRRWNV